MTSTAIAILIAGVFVSWSLDRIADAISKIGKKDED